MFRQLALAWTIEFGPIVLFFISLALLGSTEEGFVTSTAIFTASTALALLIAYVRERRIAFFPLVAGLSVIAFGVLTVYFHNPVIFMVKDTVYNGGFAILLLSGLVVGKGYLKPFFSSLFDMQDRGWYVLSVRWFVAFTALAVSNEFVWRLYGEPVWVHYKFWSTIALMVFGFYQITLSRRFRNAGASTWGLRLAGQNP